MRPAAHQSCSRNIHPPRVYLMELRHVHIHRVPSKYLHMPSSFAEKFVVSLLPNNRGGEAFFFRSKSVILLNGRHRRALVSWKIQCQTAVECLPSLRGSPSNCSLTSGQTFADGAETPVRCLPRSLEAASPLVIAVDSRKSSQLLSGPRCMLVSI